MRRQVIVTVVLLAACGTSSRPPIDNGGSTPVEHGSGSGSGTDAAASPEDAGAACIGSATISFASLTPYLTDTSTSCGSATLENGGVEYSWAPPCTTSLQGGRVALASAWQLCGDFDIQASFSLTNMPLAGSDRRWGPGLLAYDPSSADGIGIEIFEGPVTTCVPAPRNYQQWSTSTSTAPANCQVSNVPTTDTSGKMRITRTGSTVTAYYWSTSADAGAGSWAVVGTAMNMSTTPWAFNSGTGGDVASGEDAGGQSVFLSGLMITSATAP